MQQFSISPSEMADSAWRHRNLIASLVRREVVGRYRASAMGMLWSLLHPLLMLTVYTFVFSVVFKSRWSSASDSPTEFALVLFSGLMIFNLFAECVTRAPGLVLSNVNYVKRVVFPLEVLPWVALGSALFHMLVSLGIWLIFYLAVFGIPRPTIVLFLPALSPLLFLTLGLSWVLASLGVYLRDVGQVTGLATTTLMFLSPVFYPVSALPERYRVLLEWNPLTHAIELGRGVLIWGTGPDYGAFLSHLLGSMLVAWLGFAWFQKTRKGFADVL